MWLTPFKYFAVIATILVLDIFYGPNILKDNLEFSYTWASFKLPAIAIAILAGFIIAKALFIVDLLFWIFGIGLEKIGKGSGKAGKAMKKHGITTSPPESH